MNPIQHVTPEGRILLDAEAKARAIEVEQSKYCAVKQKVGLGDLEYRMRPEAQYLAHLRSLYCFGHDLPNARTGNDCRTLISLDMTYDASTEDAPVLTTRKYDPSIAIAELLGYIRGYTNAQQFADLGTPTWFANANENAAWLNNPNRKGENDVGLIYGAVARNWPIERGHIEVSFDGNDNLVAVNNPAPPVPVLNLFHKVYENLKAGKDDRGEIITFWNPGMFHLGCLRPCMYEHQFSLLGDDLYLNSTQRSNDWPLGMCANMVQVWLLLRLMAQITGKNPKIAQHRSVNAHIYKDQLSRVPKQLARQPLAQPQIRINPDIRTLEDLETWVTLKDFEIIYPEYHPVIKYPFSV